LIAIIFEYTFYSRTSNEYLKSKYTVKERIVSLLLAEAEAIKSIPVNDSYSKVIELLYEQVHLRKGKLIASGMGKAGQIAISIATTFSSTGTPAVFLHPSDSQHGDLGVIQDEDVLLLVSNSGKTREILELYQLSKNLNAKIPVIVLTGNPDSPLGEAADIVLSTGHPVEVCPLDLTPTTSTTVMGVIGDVLVVLMMEKIGFTKDDYAKRHHGGYLGQKSRLGMNS
jgi:arabinose-5-phosphate isomerase